METGQSDRQWFALRVKSRREKVVAAAAHQKGFEEFLPLCRRLQRWSDRMQPVSVPLFPGYVFCRLNPEYRLPLLTIPGVLNFVGVGKTPVAIDDGEIAAIQIAVQSELPTKPCPFPEGGNRVRLKAGPLAGVEGLLSGNNEQRQIIVALTVLKRSVAVDIEHDWVRSLERPTSDPDQYL